MTEITWFAILLTGAVGLAYHRTSLQVTTLSAVAGLILGWALGVYWLVLVLYGFLLFLILPLNLTEFRREQVSLPLLQVFKARLPPLSQIERETLEVGTVWWEGELLSGRPDWCCLLDSPRPALTEEEQAFLEGPIEELCALLNDWQITHDLHDLPPAVWDCLIRHRCFALIIPKPYGGLGFSAQAHSAVLVKVGSVSLTAAAIIAAPNALGPAGLILKYGTPEQKAHYLPRLAQGKEIPCLALTSPRAGADVSALSDTGIVCQGRFNGAEDLGIRLNWDKHHIMLAPVATVMGLVFRLYDPEHLMGAQTEYGITCALVPTHLPGITIGRRHLLIGSPFLNGPTQGKDVFIPLSYIIGGREQAGQGWHMLAEGLAVGHARWLPAYATAGAKLAALTTGAHARIRRRFNRAIGQCQSVQEPLARMAGMLYVMDAARSLTAAAIDRGEAPATAAAILKYHLTEMNRQILNHAMDIHGDKATCRGPHNYLAAAYAAAPIGITAEGANLLTRNLTIFGQGLVRCHPFLLSEIKAAYEADPNHAVEVFDHALFGHIGHLLSNLVRAPLLRLTRGRLHRTPVAGAPAVYFQRIHQFSAALALLSDVAILTLGARLKHEEMLSARLGDALSSLYLTSMTLKRFEDDSRPLEDLPVVHWACQHLLHQTETQLSEFLRNLPNRHTARLLRWLALPRGRRQKPPADRLTQTVAQLITCASPTRKRLTAGVYGTAKPTNPLGLLEEILRLADQLTPIERKVDRAIQRGTVTALSFSEQIAQANQLGILTNQEAASLLEYDRRALALIQVDDFTFETRGIDAKPAIMRPASKPSARAEEEVASVHRARPKRYGARRIVLKENPKGRYRTPSVEDRV